MISRTTPTTHATGGGAIEPVPAASGSNGAPQRTSHVAFSDALECSARTADAKKAATADHACRDETTAGNDSVAPLAPIGMIAIPLRASAERDSRTAGGNAADARLDVRDAAVARQPIAARHPASSAPQLAVGPDDAGAESSAKSLAIAAVGARIEAHHRAMPDRSRTPAKADVSGFVSQSDGTASQMDASAPSPGARAAGDATRDVPAQDLPTDPSVSRGGPVEGDAPSTPPSVDSTRASLSEPTTTEEPDATPRQTFHAAHASSRAPAGDLGRPLQHLHLRLTSGTEDDISLKLALADGALDVTIVTADAALSRYLSDERPTLLANLTASGYAVDAVSVEHRPTDQAQLAAPFASQSGMQRERSHARRNVEHADHESAASSAVDSLGDSAPARASSTERVV